MKKFIISIMFGVFFLAGGIILAVSNYNFSRAAYMMTKEYASPIDTIWKNYRPAHSVGGARYCILRQSGSNSPAEGCYTDDAHTNLYSIKQSEFVVSYNIDGEIYTETWIKDTRYKHPDTGEAFAWRVDIKNSAGQLKFRERWLATDFYAFKISDQGPTSGRDHTTWIFSGKNLYNDSSDLSTTSDGKWKYISKTNYTAKYANWQDGGAKLFPPSNQTDYDFANPQNNTLKWHVLYNNESDWCNPNRNNSNMYSQWLTYKSMPSSCYNSGWGMDVMWSRQSSMQVAKWTVQVEKF